MTITHLFFDLHGTLVEPDRMPPCYAHHLGLVMAQRFGGQPEQWSAANLRILADWDSYYADLDFDGENGLNDIWEGELRTTRALFRLTGTPEPDLKTLTALSRQLPYLATRRCDAFFPDCKAALERQRAAGYVLGIATHAILSQTRGTLTGAGVLHLFTGPLLSPDVVGRFSKDQAFFLAAGTAPETCLVIDDDPRSLTGAKTAGMGAVLMWRKKESPPPSAADAVVTAMDGLLKYVGV